MFPQQAQGPPPGAPAQIPPPPPPRTGGADLHPTPAATLAFPPNLLAFRIEVSRTY